MNSLEDLNGYAQQGVEYSDLRPSGVVFDRTTPTNFVIDILEGGTYTTPAGVEIEEIVDYLESNVRYIINLTSMYSLGAPTVTWPTLPSYLTVTDSGTGIWTVTGIRNRTDWNLVKNPTVFFGNSFFGQVVYSPTIKFLDGNPNQTFAWTVTVNVEEVKSLSQATDFSYTSGLTQTVTGVPQLIDTDPGPWTVTITPSIPAQVTTISEAGTAASSFNTTTKVLTLTGTKTEINNSLQALSIVFPVGQDRDFTLTYLASIPGESDTKVQTFRSINFTRLSDDRNTETFQTNVSTTISGGPLITDTSYTGAGLYNLEIFTDNPSIVTSMSALNSAPSLSLANTWNNTYSRNTNISSDGLVMAVSQNITPINKVNIYLRSGNNWVFAQTLTSPVSNNNFGSAVLDNGIVLSETGSRIAINAEVENSIYIFDRTSGTNTWTQTYKLITDNTVTGFGGDRVGYNGIAMSDDGLHLVAGAPLSNFGGFIASGFVAVWRWTGTAWAQYKITDPGLTDSRQFGFHVAISGDGKYFATRSENPGGYGSNTVQPTNANYIYFRSTTSFNLQATLSLTSNPRIIDFKFNSTGTELVGNAGQESTNTLNDVGVFHVWTRSGTTWTQTHQHYSVDAIDYGPVFKVKAWDLSRTGNEIIYFGAYTRADNGSAPDFDKIEIIKKTGNSWRVQSKIILPQLGSEMFLNLDTAGRVVLTDVVNKIFRMYTPSAITSSTTLLDYIEQKQVINEPSPNNTFISAVTQYGSQTAVSGDGSTMVLGSKFNVGNTLLQFLVYTRSSFTWTLQTTLSIPANGQTMEKISLSNNGNTFAVGSTLYDDGAVNNTGAVYVFTRSGTTWSSWTRLLHTGRVTQDRLGRTVSLSSDGLYLLAGADGDGTNNAGNTESQGAAYVFYFNGIEWLQQAKLTPSTRNVEESFGVSVEINGDGSTAVIGGRIGNAYVFTRNSTTWTQRQILTGQEAADSQTVTIAKQHGTIVMCRNTGSATRKIYVFTGSGSSWTLQSALDNPFGLLNSTLYPFGNNGYPGKAVISSNGNFLVVGARESDPNGNKNRGSILIFQRRGTEWTLQARYLPPAGTEYNEGFFGAGIAIDDLAQHIVASSVPQAGTRTVYFNRTLLGFTYDSVNKKLNFLDIKENINAAIDNMTMQFSATTNFDLLYKVTTPTNGTSVRNQLVIKV
jgi:hypothetical protein